jgi:hypothetical protein
MIRSETIQAFASQLPDHPFEIRLVDGQRFLIYSIEQFLMGKSHVAVLNSRGVIIVLSKLLIATLRPIPRRRAKKRA